MAVHLLCAALSVATLPDERVPCMEPCQADRVEGERQEEEVTT